MKCSKCKSEDFYEGSWYTINDDDGNQIKIHECECKYCYNVVTIRINADQQNP